jgi:hypothetical protein
MYLCIYVSICLSVYKFTTALIYLCFYHRIYQTWVDPIRRYARDPSPFDAHLRQYIRLLWQRRLINMG